MIILFFLQFNLILSLNFPQNKDVCVNKPGRKRKIFLNLKISEGPGSLGMDNPLWDPLPVEVCELLYEDMVLEQQRPPRAHAETVELVPHWGPVSRGETVWILNEKISQQFQDSF